MWGNVNIVEFLFWDSILQLLIFIVLVLIFFKLVQILALLRKKYER